MWEGVDLSQKAKFAIWDWVGVGQLIVWQCNAGSLQCQSNFCLLGDFVLLLISSLLVVGMGDEGTRIQKKWTASRRQLSSTKKK